jgi:hypothetical protein
MKIFLICSKKFYESIPPIKDALEEAGHIITLPHTFDDPGMEEKQWAVGDDAHAAWKSGMINLSEKVIEANDAVLVLNFDKGDSKNYIGGATFLEAYDAFRLGKKIFLYNDIPEGILHDEIQAFSPMVIQGDLSLLSK